MSRKEKIRYSQVHAIWFCVVVRSKVHKFCTLWYSLRMVHWHPLHVIPPLGRREEGMDGVYMGQASLSKSKGIP